jgi:hypothetical protein
VPYSSNRPDGLLLPLLQRIERAGVSPDSITLIVATGTHVATTTTWKEKHLGQEILGRYRCIDHDCQDRSLVPLGSFEGVQVCINRQFMEADIRIATGLVEPHFMAGASGGRKTVCPGLINLEATHRFHGAEFMDHPRATNLILEGNPCHEFALKVARTVGVDFSVNATVDSTGKLTGIFCGELERAHEEAVRQVFSETTIAAHHTYELVLTIGGKVAVNHYQAAKAACATIPILTQGGFVVLVAHSGDEEPVGKDEYKECLQELGAKGPGRFSAAIRDRNWQFRPDQWQVQKWDQFFQRISSFNHLVYCTTNIPPAILERLPGTSGYGFARGEERSISAMCEGAVQELHARAKKVFGRPPRTAVLPDGPYAVPLVR